MNSSSLWLPLESTQPAIKHPLMETTHTRNNLFPARWHFGIPIELTFKRIQRWPTYWRRFEMTTQLHNAFTWHKVVQNSKKAHPAEPAVRTCASAQQCSHQNTTGREQSSGYVCCQHPREERQVSRHLWVFWIMGKAFYETRQVKG